MSDQEMFVIERHDSRQSQIESMDIGDSVAIARRVDLSYGVPEGRLKALMETLRGTADQQTRRARRRFTERTFTAEQGTIITTSGAALLVVVVTRLS